MIYAYTVIKFVSAVIIMSILGVIIFYYCFLITEKKEIIIFFSLILFWCLVLPPLFTMIHEFLHIFVAKLNGIDVLGFRVKYPYHGVTYFPPGPILVSKSEAMAWCQIYIAGSLGSSFIAILSNRILYHKTRFSVFYPLNIATGFWILFELTYWIEGIDYYINGITSESDAYKFLFLYLQFEDLSPLFLKIILQLCYVAIIFWLGGSVIKKRLEYKMIKI